MTKEQQGQFNKAFEDIARIIQTPGFRVQSRDGTKIMIAAQYESL
jgi:hypothetical protein